MVMDYKLLVLDIDGTLANNKKEITPYTLEVINEVQASGVKVVLASGRPTYGIVPIAEKIGMDKFGGYILSFNGGKIIEYPSMEVVYESTLPLELIPSLYDIAKSKETNIITYQDKYIITETEDDKYVQHEIMLTKMTPKKVDNFVEYVDFIPDKCLIVGDPEKLIPMAIEINNLFGDKMSAFRSEPFFLELVPKGIDKALSLERLLAVLDFKREEMIAAGDGFNDLSMIKYAGLGVAMANAQEAVKEVADYITLSNEEDGVAYMAKKFILK